MGVRQREAGDVSVLSEIVRAAGAEGYPPHRSGPVERFVVSDNELISLVDDRGGMPAGHVALLEWSARSVMDLAAAAIDQDPSQLASVARLAVDPQHRRDGVATALMSAVSEAAHGMGRRPVLDVWQGLPGAVAFYDSLPGWCRVGSAVINFRSPCSEFCVHDGTSITSFVYVGPTGGDGDC